MGFDDNLSFVSYFEWTKRMHFGSLPFGLQLIGFRTRNVCSIHKLPFNHITNNQFLSIFNCYALIVSCHRFVQDILCVFPFNFDICLVPTNKKLTSELCQSEKTSNKQSILCSFIARLNSVCLIRAF